MGIKVKAMQAGYYGVQRRRIGDVFEIESEKDRGLWMGDVDDPIINKEAMPFTSNVQGTKAAGNIHAAAKEAWEEPVGESRPKPDKSPVPEKKKSRSKTRR
jgi:hypothetical protein